jgi:hypothetical protein
LTLGRVAGPQGFAATAAGSFSVAIPATATPGAAASITAVSGSGQADTIGRSLPQPFVVRVTDQFSNPVSGTTVTWTHSGDGTLSAATSITNTDGLAQVSYTFGSKPGSETVTAAVSGAGTPATFTATAKAGAAVAIAGVSGGSQTSTPVSVLSSPLVVKVTDAAGNPSADAVVTWKAENATLAQNATTTDASGLTSNTVTLGRTAGQASITAVLTASKQVTFVATIVAGPTLELRLSAQPADIAAGGLIVPIQVTQFDGWGNQTKATSSVSTSLGSGTLGAELSGKLTRSATNGVATFDDLRIDKQGTGYTLAFIVGQLKVTTSTFNVVASGAATVTKVAGDNQSVAAGDVAAVAPVVKVTDAFGNPIAGIAVTFTPASGSGSVTGGATTTDATGAAKLEGWKVGTVPGSNSLTAAAAGVGSATFAATVVAAQASKLVMATEPSSSGTSGVALATQPVVQVQDQFGNAVSTTGISITASVSAGSLVGGTTVTTNASGKAAFADLAITGSGSVTLAFASTGLSSATSRAISVIGAAKTVAANGATSFAADVGQLVTTPPSVIARDASGTAVSGVTVQFELASGHGTFTGGAASETLTTDKDGVATASGWRMPVAAGVYTMKATAVGMTVSFTANALPVGAVKLGFVTQPSNTNAGAAMSALKVAVQDASGAMVSAATGTVTLALATGPSGGHLVGTLSASVTGGVATFDNVSGDIVGAYTIKATSDGLSDATSTGFSVAAGPKTKLVIGAQATSGKAGVSLSPALTVSVVDAFGNVTAATDNVTMSLASGSPAGATLSGAKTKAAVNGVATFSDLSVDKAATAYKLTATSGDLTSATTGTIDVTAGDAAKLAFLQQPTNVASTTAISPAVVIQVLDQFGNIVGEATNAITLAITSGTGASGATLGGAGAVNAVNGNATFTAVKVDKAGGGYKLTATASGLTSVTSNAFDVSAAGAASMVANGATSFASQVSTALSGSLPSVVVKDASGNVVSGTAVKFELESGSGTIGSGASETVTTNGSGVATVSNWTLPATAGAYTMKATAGSLTVSFTATALPVGATKLAFLSDGQPQNVAAGTASAAIRVAIQDGSGTTAATATGTVTLELGSGPSGGQLLGTLSATTVSGVATFSDVSADIVGTYTVRAKSTGLTDVTSSAFSVSAGAKNKLAFSTQPQNATSLVALQPVVVQLQDKFGNVASGATDPITVELVPATGVTGAALTGTLQVTAVSSSASFSDLKIAKAATGYKLKGTAAGLTAATSSAFDIGAAAAAKYVLSSTTSTPAAASTTTVTAQLADASNNGVSTSGVTVSWALGPASGAGTLSASSSATNASGQATITYTAPTSAGTAVTVTASDGSSRSGTLSLTSAAGAATKLALIGSIPSSGQNRDKLATFAVQVQDANGNGASSVGVAVTADLQSGAGGALSGTLQRSTDATGRANFDDLVVTGVVGTYVVRFHATGLTDVTKSVSITAGAKAKLAFTQQPATVDVGTAITPAPKVAIQDADGNTVTAATDNVVVSLNAPAGVTAVLSGTKTQAAASGLATFADLTVDAPATDYTLTATSGSLSSATSSVFNIGGSGAVAGLSLTVGGGKQPADTVKNDTQFADGAKVQLIDATGAAVSLADVDITVEVMAPKGASGDLVPGGPVVFESMFALPTVTPGSTKTNAKGVADFTSMRLRGLSQAFGLKFSATVNGRTYTRTTGDIKLRPGAAKGIARDNSFRSLAAAGAKLPAKPRVRVVDIDGNSVKGASVSFAAKKGTLTGATTATTDDNGLATGPDWKLPSSDATDTVVATVGDTVVRFVVEAARASKLKVSKNPQASVGNGKKLDVMKVQIQDASGRDLGYATDTISAAGKANGQGLVFDVLSTSPIVVDSDGVASFPALQIDGHAHKGAKVKFTSAVGLSADSTTDIEITAGDAAFLDGLDTLSAFSAAVRGKPSKAPQAKITDFNRRNTVTSASNTITWTGCTSVATADDTKPASGVVSASLTGGNSHGSCRLQAQASGLSGTPRFNFVVKPTETTRFWTGGAGSDDWSQPGNWDNGAVPGSTTDVFVPQVFALKPKLSANGQAKSIVVDVGSAKIDIGGKTLSVSGDVDGSGTGIIGTGTLSLLGSASDSISVRGTVSAVTLGVSGSCPRKGYALTGSLSVTSLATNCSVALGANALTASGNASISTKDGILDVGDDGSATVSGDLDVFEKATLKVRAKGKVKVNPGELKLHKSSSVDLDGSIDAPKCHQHNGRGADKPDFKGGNVVGKAALALACVETDLP